MTVKVVKPIKITEAVLTASSIPEPDASVGEVEWVDGKGEKYTAVDSGKKALTVATDTNSSTDYVVTGSTFDFNVQDYIGGILQNTRPFPAVDYQPSDSCFNNGYVYVADLVGIRWFDISSGNSGDVGGLNTLPSTTYSGIAFSEGIFYAYDDENDKLQQYTFASPTNLTFSSEIDFTIDGYSPKLEKYGTGFVFLVDGKLKIYDQSLKAIREVTLPEHDLPLDYLSCISSNGENFNIVNNTKSTVSYYDKDLVFLGNYQPEERAILTSTHKLYQCVKATNIRPDLGATGDETESWVEVGATNKFASFDDRLFYPAKITGAQTFELTITDRLNTVAFLNLAGITSVRVQMEVGGSIVYDEKKDGLDFSLIYDHYTWWFSDSELLTELIFDDLPPYPNSKLIIDVTGEGDLGQIVTGFAKEIGICLAESSSNTIDLSTQEFDAFGNRKYVPRPIIKLNKYEILSDKSAGPAIERLFKEIAGGNALWIGEIGGGQLLTTYGYTERSPIPYNMPDNINYSATIRGSA